MDTFHNIGTSTDWIVMVVYFMAIMLFGSYFGRYTRNTSDFFFGGRRFSWWLIAMSIVATGVGSHSFVKYSAKAFEHGFSSSMTYINDWFFVPFFLFGWLPIIVYTKVRSIPEYFEKRFSPSARFLATILLMMYMIGYIGIGFLTLGKAVLPMLPEAMTMLGTSFDITLMRAVIVIAIITGIYITFGGQTAVIFTDLLQGFILIFAGLFLFALGIANVGEKAAYLLAQNFERLENLAKADVSDLERIHEIGTVIAVSVVSFFKRPETQKIIHRFKRAGVNFPEPTGAKKNNKLKGKKFVFTGEIESMTRSQAGRLVKELGGDVVSSVSKNTDFVVSGKSPVGNIRPRGFLDWREKSRGLTRSSMDTLTQLLRS